ncbi:23S rRNA (uracil(1939)-C(5))-methyltransferase RlmD [Vibrio sp. TH_r3]|uniref:23S rRNA (uracil(1939)-C(5))-methyltransferase RlmD n=1 Tax=Vibrio sp. TH_r3 TaxID=3082084 RepID=UPI0029556FD6|nr:23S rRNA (uracil(1939)-C(5))-methyltransferase RlmD [Vibrio sp. TH_r3]MDV7105179.1 23S rRNA (uracil(1939)-C(5))-methyltransferase RlmD [Vibrio sp. TH_r3]
MARFYQPKKKIVLDTKHQQFDVERLDHHGAGIAWLKNKPVFIEGTLPGEKVLAQLTENKSKFSRAKLIKILTPSPQRIEPFCPHYQDCGGCNMQHLSYDAQIEYKQQSLSQLITQFSTKKNEPREQVPFISGDPLGYRRRARISLYLNKKNAQLEFGFRKKQSKQIVQVSQCAALEPKLNQLLPELYTLLSLFKKPGELGHVELALGDNQPVVTLRVMKTLPEQDLSALIQFAKTHQLSMYLLVEKEPLQLIFGEKPSYSEGGFTIPFLPTNFIQVNRKVNQQMVEQAIKWLSLEPKDRVLDLFCGLGNFSLPIALKAHSVVGVEGVQEMVEQAEDNAKLNNIDNIQFYHANLENDIIENDWAQSKFDKVLLDPARAGAASVVEQLSKLGVHRVVYVSCNPATLARDSKVLLEQGFKLIRLGMLDMFPHTSHFESMALFEQQKVKRTR